jgi:hypothetical protein
MFRIYFVFLVKPFPDISLYQFIDRKAVGKKGKQIQERLENSILAFESAFAYTSDPWRKSGNWPKLLINLENMSRSVKHYNNRYALFVFIAISFY